MSRDFHNSLTAVPASTLSISTLKLKVTSILLFLQRVNVSISDDVHQYIIVLSCLLNMGFMFYLLYEIKTFNMTLSIASILLDNEGTSL